MEHWPRGSPAMNCDCAAALLETACLNIVEAMQEFCIAAIAVRFRQLRRASERASAQSNAFCPPGKRLSYSSSALQGSFQGASGCCRRRLSVPGRTRMLSSGFLAARLSCGELRLRLCAVGDKMPEYSLAMQQFSIAAIAV